MSSINDEKYVKHYITYNFVCNSAKEKGTRFSWERSLKDFEFCWFDIVDLYFIGCICFMGMHEGSNSCCYV